MPSSLLGRFLLTGAFWLVACLALWYPLAAWLALPASWLAELAMHLFFGWVDGIERAGTVLTLVTRLEVQVPQGAGYALAVVTPDVDYLKYGYGVALLWALLLASRAERLLRKGLLGTLALLPCQGFGIVLDWLKTVAIQGGQVMQTQLDYAAWQLESVALGYQFGYLVMPTLAPVLLWLAMDRRFLATLWLEASLSQGTPDKAGPG